MGFLYYYGERDYERALIEFAIAQRGLPNDADIPRAIGAIERRQGKWQESTKSYRKAVSLNPRDAVLLRNLALNYVATRDYPMAAKTFDRAVALSPLDFEMNSPSLGGCVLERGLRALRAIAHRRRGRT